MIMQFKSLKSENLSERVVQEITHMIETGQLKPGDKLPTETVFAEELGVSRGILREALTILQYRGFISRKPKDGTYIREIQDYNFINESILGSIKKASYRDLLEMRESLEQKIVELAIKRAKDEEIDDIERYMEEAAKANTYNSMIDYNFHLKLAELSKNVLLLNFINLYYDLIHELGESNLKKEDRRREVYAEHMNIIKAIKKRDIEQAKKEIVYHLGMVEKSIDKIEINKSIDTK